jgi:hypothetical protein
MKANLSEEIISQSRFYAKKIIFLPILGGARAGCAPPWIRPCIDIVKDIQSAWKMCAHACGSWFLVPTDITM